MGRDYLLAVTGSTQAPGNIIVVSTPTAPLLVTDGRRGPFFPLFFACQLSSAPPRTPTAPLVGGEDLFFLLVSSAQHPQSKNRSIPGPWIYVAVTGVLRSCYRVYVTLFQQAPRKPHNSHVDSVTATSHSISSCRFYGTALREGVNTAYYVQCVPIKRKPVFTREIFSLPRKI